MNAYCTDFLHSDFSHWRSHTDLELTDNLYHSDIPAVEIKGLAIETITDVYQACLTNQQEFRPMHTANIARDWYFRPRTAGWNEICVNFDASTHRILRLHDSHEAQDQILPVPTANEAIRNACEIFFHRHDLDLVDTFILRLDAGGWIGPHIDKKNVDPGLTYFWMPLHDFAGPVMKVFPWGWLQHRLGCLYLFNHCRYVHAVTNGSADPRFVMTGRIKRDYVPDWILHQFQTALNEDWQLIWHD